MIDYPDNLLRGLSAEDWVSDGLVTAAAFQIKFEAPFLKDGRATQSIFWEDDDSVINLMLQQKREDHFQFKAGIARLPRESVEHIMRLPVFTGILSYERDRLPDNPYHGNLLVGPGLNSTQRKLLPGVMASHVSDLIPRS